MVVYHLKCKNCEANYIGQTKCIYDVRMNDHQTDKNSHVFEHHNIPGHEIDFETVNCIFLVGFHQKIAKIYLYKTKIFYILDF
jgi:hypothetical protein